MPPPQGKVQHGRQSQITSYASSYHVCMYSGTILTPHRGGVPPACLSAQVLRAFLATPHPLPISIAAFIGTEFLVQLNMSELPAATPTQIMQASKICSELHEQPQFDGCIREDGHP